MAGNTLGNIRLTDELLDKAQALMLAFISAIADHGSTMAEARNKINWHVSMVFLLCFILFDVYW